MKKIFAIIIISTVVLSCQKKDKKGVYFVSPIEGSSVKTGSVVNLKTDAEPGSFDSIRYYIDEKLSGTKKDTSSIAISTNGFPLGGRLLTAKVYSKGDSTELTTNIQLLPSKAPINYSFTVVNTFPHDTSSYTQGLEFHDGILYESDGLRGESSLRKVDFKTGKVLKKIDIASPVFSEGITLVNDKIIMLTYQEGVALVYDKNTFAKLSQFPVPPGREGWGAAYDGNHILTTDGTNHIYFLNKDTYKQEKSVEVYDINGPVDNLNELEIIDGKIFANIYMKDRIVIINPASGMIEGELNLQDIAPYQDRFDTGYVLNGIAWDAKGKRLFVTGKKWNKLFEIKINRGK